MVWFRYIPSCGSEQCGRASWHYADLSVSGECVVFRMKCCVMCVRRCNSVYRGARRCQTLSERVKTLLINASFQQCERVSGGGLGESPGYSLILGRIVYTAWSEISVK